MKNKINVIEMNNDEIEKIIDRVSKINQMTGEDIDKTLNDMHLLNNIETIFNADPVSASTAAVIEFVNNLVFQDALKYHSSNEMQENNLHIIHRTTVMGCSNSKLVNETYTLASKILAKKTTIKSYEILKSNIENHLDSQTIASLNDLINQENESLIALEQQFLNQVQSIEKASKNASFVVGSSLE